MTIFMITGGSRGLGAALARQLSARGDRVVSLSRTAPPEGCVHLPLDLSRTDTFEAAMTSFFEGLDLEADERSGRVDMTLINNAGTLDPIGLAGTCPMTAMEKNLAVNFIAPVLLTHLFLKYSASLAANRQVVNISSGAAHTPYEGWGLYCGAKAGLEQFGRCTAGEQSGIRDGATVINFNPGVMDTDMQSLIRNTPEDRFPRLQRFIALHKDRALTNPETVAAALIRGLDQGGLESGRTYSAADFT